MRVSAGAARLGCYSIVGRRPRFLTGRPRISATPDLRLQLYDQDLVLTVVLRHDIVLGTVPPHDFADVTVQDFMAASFLPLNVSVSQVDDQAIKPGSGRLRSWTGSGAFNPGHSYPIILEFYSRLSCHGITLAIVELT